MVSWSWSVLPASMRYFQIWNFRHEFRLEARLTKVLQVGTGEPGESNADLVDNKDAQGGTSMRLATAVVPDTNFTQPQLLAAGPSSACLMPTRICSFRKAEGDSEPPAKTLRCQTPPLFTGSSHFWKVQFWKPFRVRPELTTSFPGSLRPSGPVSGDGSILTSCGLVRCLGTMVPRFSSRPSTVSVPSTPKIES